MEGLARSVFAKVDDTVEMEGAGDLCIGVVYCVHI